MEPLVLRDSITGSLTDDEFLKFCLENPRLRIERNSNLQIVIMSPVTTLSASHSAEVFGQLYQWNRQRKLGVVFDSSAGFTLPDRSVFSPDAAFVSLERWNALSKEDKNKFAMLSPEFVIEVRSKTDELSDLKKKMTSWLANEVQMGWLIDPIERTSYIFRQGLPVEIVVGFDQFIRAQQPVEGFELDLSLLKS